MTRCQPGGTSGATTARRRRMCRTEREYPFRRDAVSGHEHVQRETKLYTTYTGMSIADVSSILSLRVFPGLDLSPISLARLLLLPKSIFKRLNVHIHFYRLVLLKQRAHYSGGGGDADVRRYVQRVSKGTKVTRT